MTDVPPEVAAAPPADHIGRYIAAQALGVGGMGEVRRAYDTGVGRWVALKIIRSDDPEDLARFKREARTAATLTHPNIGAVYEVGEHQGRHFIAMQLIDGRTLKAHPRDDRRALVEVVRDAARAVHYAHGRDVIHRDLKPENIMVEQRDGRRIAYVLDFGLAKPLRSRTLTISGTLVGTPCYMSPEQARGDEADARCDVYGLGATLYEMMADRPPFPDASLLEVVRRVVEEEPVPVPGEIGVIIAKAMEKDRARRYPTAAALADDLDRWLAGEPIRARPASAVYRLRKTIARRRGIVLTATASLGLAVLLLTYFLSQLEIERRERERLERFREEYGRAMARVNALQLAVAARSPRRSELGAAADAALRGALAIDPGHAASHVWLGRCRRLVGGNPSPHWDDALRADPRHAEAHFERGRQALERYQLLRRDPATIVARGRTSYRERDPETAEELVLRTAGEADLSRALECGLAGHLAGYLEALSAFGRGDYATAEASLDRYLENIQWEAAAYLLRARARQYQAKAPQAERDFRDAVLLDPTSADTFNLRAEFLSSLKRHAEAEADYTEALRLDPRNSMAYNNRGRLRHELGRHAEAEADYSKAIELRPAYTVPLNNRGNLYYDTRRYAESEADYTRALTIDPGYALSYNNRGRLYSAQKRFDLALADYSKAVEINPRYARALYNRGRVLRDLDRLDEADADYTRAIDADPDYATAYNSRGNLCHDRKVYERAEADYTKAIEIDPSYVIAWTNRGNLHYDLKRWVLSLADYTKAIEIDPRHARAYNLRGLCHRQMNNDADAEADYTKALAIDPGYALAWRHRGNLRYDQKRWADAADDWEKAVAAEPSMEPKLRAKIEEARKRAGL